MTDNERFYGVAETARLLGVADNTIRNYANKDEIQELLSDRATRQGKYIGKKGRAFTRDDVLIFNTLVKRVNSATDWTALAWDIENGDIDKQIDRESIATLKPDDTDYHINLIELQAKIIVLESQLEQTRNENAQLRTEKETDIKDHYRQIGRLEYEVELLKKQIEELEGDE